MHLYTRRHALVPTHEPPEIPSRITRGSRTPHLGNPGLEKKILSASNDQNTTKQLTFIPTLTKNVYTSNLFY